MSVYAAVLSGVGNTALTVGVKAGIYPIKVILVDITGGNSVNSWTITEYAAATLSAGSAITPFPLRFGAPAASSTARSGSPTGTATVLKGIPAAVPVAAGATIQYTPPASLILPPGAAIGATNTTSSLVIIYFDELEIQPGY